MNPATLKAIAYRLRHSTTTQAKRNIIDSYPELKGKPIKTILALIRVQEEIVENKPITKRNRWLRSYYARGKQNEPETI